MSYNHQSLKYAAYKTAQYNVSKTRQIVMLYDGALRFIQKAIEAIKANDIQERYNNLHKASKIMMGLQASLDFDNGGEIATILDQYYYSIDIRLIRAQGKNDLEAVQQIKKEVQMMKEAWDEVDQMTTLSEHLDDKQKDNVVEDVAPNPVASSNNNASSQSSRDGTLSLDI